MTQINGAFRRKDEFACEYCPKSFKTHRGLSIHKFSMHKRHIPRYCNHFNIVKEEGHKVCLNCGKIFLP